MTRTRFLIFILIPVAGSSLPAVGNAHHTQRQWKYPPACCRGNEVGGDCEPIPGAEIKKGRKGFSVHLHPGDHHAATREHLFFVPYGNELPSGDSDFHICLHPNEDYLDCFFAPPADIRLPPVSYAQSLQRCGVPRAVQSASGRSETSSATGCAIGAKRSIMSRLEP